MHHGTARNNLSDWRNDKLFLWYAYTCITCRCLIIRCRLCVPESRRYASDLEEKSWRILRVGEVGAGVVDSEFETVTNRVGVFGNHFFRLRIELDED